MSPRRFACVCSSWTQRREVLLLARSLSGSATQEEVTFTELAEKPSASTTEPLFGIAPRKLRNVEDEDFVSSSTFPRPQDAHPHQNYFSQTWAEQRSLPKVADPLESDSLDKELVSPGPSMHASLPQRISTQRSAPRRVWLVTSDLQASTQETFTFASFKVLAMQVAYKHRTQLFNHVPSAMLAWQNRSKKILAGLEQCSADIVCLQEVDKFNELQSQLSWKGYTGLYKASTGTEPSGCAIFWRQERFQLLHEESLAFSLFGMRDNVAQLCVLQSTVPGTRNMEATSISGNQGLNQSKCLIVGNIDVFFNPKRGLIKLGQCRTFLEQAHKLSILWPGAPLIIGGCFHLTPQSALYNFLANSRLDLHGLECLNLSGQLQLPATSAREVAKHLGAINMTTSGKGKPSSELRTRLRKSLLAKFASKQETDALDFANSAKELLSNTSGIVSPSVLVSNDRHVQKNASAKTFVSKTIEILESCTNNSQTSLRSMATNVSEMDAAPSSSKVMDTSTLSANASTSSESGSKMGLPSKSWIEAPEQKKLYGIDRVLNDACNVPRTLCAEVSCDNAAPSSILAADTTKTSMDQCSSADSPEQAAPDHGWDLEELKLAIGSADTTVATHKLKLFSVYPEIPGSSKTRDDKGEPCVTMCHKEFRGTVDYIWRSNGLKTAKVLDTFSLTDMVATPVLPFMACGSDHIFLACELAFTSN